MVLTNINTKFILRFASDLGHRKKLPKLTNGVEEFLIIYKSTLSLDITKNAVSLLKQVTKPNN